MLTSLQAVWTAYYHGKKQNRCHYKAYCKGCVCHEEAQMELLDKTIILEPELDVTTTLLAKKWLFKEGKQVQVTHFISWQSPFYLFPGTVTYLMIRTMKMKMKTATYS